MGMGGGGSGGGAPAPQAQNTVQVQRPPPYVEQWAPQFMQDAYDVSQMPYNPYPGGAEAMVEGLNPTHQYSLDQGRGYLQNYLPGGMNALSSIAGGLASSTNPWERSIFTPKGGGGGGPGGMGGAGGIGGAGAPGAGAPGAVGAQGGIGNAAAPVLPPPQAPQAVASSGPPPGAAKAQAAPADSMWGRGSPAAYAEGNPNVDVNDLVSQREWSNYLGLPTGGLGQTAPRANNLRNNYDRNDPPSKYELGLMQFNDDLYWEGPEN